MKHIAVLCSGGDAPGMNCAIRAVVRTALSKQIQVTGIQKGYSGLLAGDFIPLSSSAVGNILQRGGTILQTSRCKEFHQAEARKEAFNLLKRNQIDGLVVIGGEGSFNGAFDFSQENKFPVVGIPGTIDNDIANTEYTIGFDTAVKTAVEAVDKIRDTAHAHARTFIVEVMGRSSSSIAIQVGLASGAENVITFDNHCDVKQISDDIQRGLARGKQSSIIIVAEGARPGKSSDIQKSLKDEFQIDSRVCILGHIQRGGAPTTTDRIYASQMGYHAVEGLLGNITSKKLSWATVVQQGTVKLVPLEDCLEKNNHLLDDLLPLVKLLAT